MRRAWVLSASLLGAACSTPEALRIEGALGQPISADFRSGVPRIPGSVDGVAVTFTVDTGSPLTIVDDAVLLDPVAQADLSVFGVTFLGKQLVSAPLFASDGPPQGLLGGDILAQLALGMDPREGVLVLDEPATLTPTADGPVTTHDLGLAGGGTVWVGDMAIEAGSTRQLVQVWLEARQWPLWAVIDTGASAVVVSPELGEELLSTDPGRPQLQGARVRTPEGEALVDVIRLGSLGPGTSSDERQAVIGVPALVIQDGALFDEISLEVGEPVELILGGTWLRHFATVLDPTTGTLRVAPYQALPHISLREFVGMGMELVPFVTAQGTTAFRVGVVYPGKSADKVGILTGDLVHALQGKSLVGKSAVFIADLLGSVELGGAVTVAFERDNVKRDVVVHMEDLLPPYPSPSPSALTGGGH